MSVGATLKAARIAAWISQAAVAEHVGVSRVYVARVESGDLEPSLARYVQLCEAIGVEPGETLMAALCP